jgi:hypothetical protein
VDAAGHVWTLATGPNGSLIVDEDGAPAGYTNQVIALAYVNHVVSQENSSHGWWSWSGTAWAGESDPTVACHGTGSPEGGTSDDAGVGHDAASAGDAAPPIEAGAGVDGGGAPIGDPTGTSAVKVSDFLDSLGINVHVSQGADAPTQSATAMSYAGIRNFRDAAFLSNVQGYITMHQVAGVRACLVGSTGGTASPTNVVAVAKQLNAVGALLAVEGPNEPNNFPITYLGQTNGFTTTFMPVAQFQRDLYAAVKAEPSLQGIPVFHTSEAGGSEPDNVGLQFLTIPAGAGTLMPAGTKYADYANTHNYVCGHSQTLVDNVAWNASDPTLNGEWDGLYVEYGRTWRGGFAGYSTAELPNLPWVSTETGWVTSGSGAITQEQQGRVFLNLYLAAFKRGIAYTFIFMLKDDPVQGYWGLFDTSYNPKISGTYVHNLTTILADTGARAPGKLDYTIANEPATVHDLLMQKSDGTFELAVWDERPTGGSDVVTVNLGASRATVKIYDPTTGTSPSQTLSGVSSVVVTLTDHPVIIEL